MGRSCLQDVGPDQIVQLKQPEIPTPEGLRANKRSLFQRWSFAKEFNYSIVYSEAKTIKLTRVSESTLRKRCRTGSNTFFSIALGSASQIALFVAPVLVLLSYVVGPKPMDLQFWSGAVTMVMMSAVTATFITNSGRSAWFIGALLLFICVVLAMTLHMVPPGSQGPV